MTGETFFQWYDRMGRPTLRNVGVILLLLIGLAIVIQFFFWAVTNREPAPIPLGNIFVAVLPYAMQVAQEVTRSLEKQSTDKARVQIIEAGGSLPNPHGGPGAP